MDFGSHTAYSYKYDGKRSKVKLAYNTRFAGGDTEYNYIDKMRKNQGVELVLKPINMHGGGYSNFLRQIKKEAQSNYLAKFIIVDADRIKTISLNFL